MAQFEIDDDVVALIADVAKPKPFESLSSALRRVLTETKQGTREKMRVGTNEKPTGAEEHRSFKPSAERMRAPSPDPQLWVSRVPELRAVPRLTSWRAICEHLEIEVAGDSARRKLREWVGRNRPSWAQVPDA